MRNLIRLRLLFIGLLLCTTLNTVSQELESDRKSIEIPIGNELHKADLLAMDIIKSIEGFKSKAYKGPGGKSLIGYGFTNRKESSLTREESEIILYKIYTLLKMEVKSSIKHNELNHSQIAALTSFTYSVGTGAFRRSTLLKRVNSMKLESVQYELSRWTKTRRGDEVKELAGLVKRRKMESELWAMNL